VTTKLNLCCGQMILQGYVNIDAYPGPDVDVVSDALDLRYQDSSVDEVVMFHAIEHFSLDDACTLLRRIFFWLKPGGHIIVEGPDVCKAVKNCKQGDFESIVGIFGDITQLRLGREGYQHKWGWTGALMQQELASAGFNVGHIEDGLSHAGYGWRDYRVVGFKPKINSHGN